MVQMTNADRIRAMTDEELAERLQEDYCPDNCDTCAENCKSCWLQWLQQPANTIISEELCTKLQENRNKNKRCKDYVGIACINGSCPIANREEYEERCIPVIKKCFECPMYMGCEDCAIPYYTTCEKREYNDYLFNKEKNDG